MPRLRSVRIENFRSICGPIQIDLPQNRPVVLIGENNAGKSNIASAFNLVLGPMWQGSHDPEDHEFYCRDRGNPIEISAHFDRDDKLGGCYSEVRWCYDAATGKATYKAFPSQRGYSSGDFVSNEVKDACVCIVIEADRNLGYHLSYATKFTLLSKLMHRFHKALLDDPRTKDELEALFSEVKVRFERIVPFAEFTASLQTQLGDFIGTMTHLLQVDFQAYNPINFFHALRLHASENGEPRTLAELGTGEQQILALSFAYAYATAFHGGIMLVIEEPEAHLHPLAQQWLARRLLEMCEGGLQIVVTTHSPHFINMLHLEGIVAVRKGEYGTGVIQVTREDLVKHCLALGADPGRTRRENILPFYRANATPEILEGFFSKAVVLVEGPTEAMALPVYLEKCGLMPSREGLAIIPVQGKGNLAKWRRLFTAYEIPTFIVFDNDTNDDKKGEKRRDALRSVGVPDSSHDDVIRSEDWIIGEGYCLFGKDFETSLRQAVTGYGELEDEARTGGIDSKPFVARWVAERLPHNAAEEGWKRFEALAAALWSLMDRSPTEEVSVSPKVAIDITDVVLPPTEESVL